MTLEYLEIMEDVKSEELRVKSEECEATLRSLVEEFAPAQKEKASKTARRKLQRSFKSNTRIYDDGSIEVDPQAQGEPSQKEVKKVGKSKRYITSGKNPLTCVELKCPDDVADKAAYFHQELAKLTKDMEIEKPELPDGEFLVNKENLKVCFEAKKGKVTAWLTFEVEGLLDIRKQLYQLTSEIDKCFVINEALVTLQR